jgi:hypothetical protein
VGEGRDMADAKRSPRPKRAIERAAIFGKPTGNAVKTQIFRRQLYERSARKAPH